MRKPPILLWSDPAKKDLTLTPYLVEDGKARGAVLVIPGGGYGSVCEKTEGEPIARAFNEKSYHAFVLNYRVAPHRFPEPQQDAVRAIRLIRRHAAEWNVIPDRIAVCGFSAGAHLAGCLGTITESIPDVEHDETDRERASADAMILCYGVLCFEDWSHLGTQKNLLGDRFADESFRTSCSLEKQAGPHTPPTFLWHTAADQLVPFENSLRFARAVISAGRPAELHVFPYGGHGMLLGTGTPDISRWPELAVSFLNQQWEMRDGDADALLADRYSNIYEKMQGWLASFKD